MILTFECVTAMVGPPVAGFIHDANGSYDIGFVLAGLAMVLCSIPFLFLPYVRYTASIARLDSGCIAF